MAGPALLLLVALSVAPPGRTAEPPRLLIGAAASLRGALDALLPSLQRALPAARLEVTYAASSTLLRQVREGAPIDLFLSADERTIDTLAAQDLLLPGTRTDLLGNSLVAIAPDDSPLQPKAPRDLLGPSVRRVAVPDDQVPVGHYAREWLRAQGLGDALADRAVRTEDARATTAAVESGAVDLAFVYRTDARTARRVKVVFAIADGPRIVYPAAVVRGDRSALATQLLELLKSADARAAFEAAGFTFLAPRK